MVERAQRNTDDNARVEFNSPKSLGHETLDDNIALLRRYAGNLFDYLDPPIEDVEAQDELRLALAEKMMDRGDYDLARKSARQISRGPLRARAEQLLSDLGEQGSGI
jgi:hypothetical protein